MNCTGLTEAEWGVVERLAECHSLMAELPGLDAPRFDAGVQALQEQVLALPAKRALKHREGQAEAGRGRPQRVGPSGRRGGLMD
jgi:hypothetical protein